MKVHLFKYIESAFRAWSDGSADRDVALNQTECGYIRDNITQDKALVTCKLCQKLINKGL
ncbi:MAG: hypothetical protein COA78_21230 [Blastopirellula sp.]|nr:MAG: hypothetical protein COA78_21230 [Blastopirellula sp.]